MKANFMSNIVIGKKSTVQSIHSLHNSRIVREHSKSTHLHEDFCTEGKRNL